MLTQASLKRLFHYDPNSGIFRSITDGVISDKPAGFNSGKGYVMLRVFKKNIFAHRLAFLYMLGRMPLAGVDHVNGIRSDNSWVNLREATQKQNCENKVVRVGVSGFPGVHRHNNRWVSKIVSGRKKYYLGCFKTAEEAAEAYLKAKAELHKYCPNPRFDTEGVSDEPHSLASTRFR